LKNLAAGDVVVVAVEEEVEVEVLLAAVVVVVVVELTCSKPSETKTTSLQPIHRTKQSLVSPHDEFPRGSP